MLIDILREDYIHFRAYVQLADGHRPGDVEDNAMAFALDCDGDNLHVTSWTTITEPNDWDDDYEYDLWQDALATQEVLWRLRGVVGDIPI